MKPRRRTCDSRTIVSIRHTHTQLYLTVDYSNIDLAEGTDELPQRIAVTTSSSPTIANVFIFQASRGKHMSSLSNVGTNLKNTGATSLRDEMKCWLEHTFFASNSRDVGGVPYRLQSLPGQGLYLSPALHNADVFVLRSAVPSEAITPLTRFDMVAIISRCANGHWNDEQSQEELRVVLATIKHLCINAEAVIFDLTMTILHMSKMTSCVTSKHHLFFLEMT